MGTTFLNLDTESVPTGGAKLMKRDFVSRVMRTQMDLDFGLDICINKGTSFVRVITDVVPATTPPMPKSE